MCFSGKNSIRQIKIGDEVTSIGKEAFYGCFNLRKVEIPKSVKSIGERAFECCPIKEVKLPFNTEYKPDSFDEVTKVVRAKVTISYSHDNKEHKDWVRKLATENSSVRYQATNAVFSTPVISQPYNQASPAQYYAQGNLQPHGNS